MFETEQATFSTAGVFFLRFNFRKIDEVKRNCNCNGDKSKNDIRTSYGFRFCYRIGNAMFQNKTGTYDRTYECCKRVKRTTQVNAGCGSFRRPKGSNVWIDRHLKY